MFFQFIVPPLVFAAGYNLQQKLFFKYFNYIMIYGILGTLVTFLIVAPVSCLLNYYEVYHVNFTIQQLMIFSAVICSTDTIACITFIDEDEDPKLFSLLFGEGVINDAVTICLYQLVSKYNPDKDGITIGMFGELSINFIYLFVLSTLIGVFIGFLCTIFLKKMKRFRFDRVQENLVIFFFAFFSYGIPQVLQLSPIISLLFCSIFMSHYAFYNISFQAREESCVVSKVLSNMATAFVYSYLGLTCLSRDAASFNLKFAAIQVAVVAFGRYVTVYLLAYIINFANGSWNTDDPTINSGDRGVMAYAGTIRGAIAFGLSVSINTGDIFLDKLLSTSVLSIVVFTIITFGIFMPLIVQFYKTLDNTKSPEQIRKDEDQQQSLLRKKLKYDKKVFALERKGSHILHNFEDAFLAKFTYFHPNNDEEEDTNFMDNWFSRWDEMYIKPYLIYNYPESKKDNIAIASRLKGVFNDYYSQKIAKNIFVDAGIIDSTRSAENTDYIA